MHRRQFLIGTVTLVIASDLRADPPPIHTLDRLHLDLDMRKIPDITPLSITGWKVTIDEDRSMDVLAWNAGPLKIKFGFAIPKQGFWQAQAEWFIAPGEAAKLVHRRKPENEDYFFYARVNNPRRCANCYDPISGDVPNSNAGIFGDNSKCHMSWNKPQELHLQVQAAP